MWHSEDHRPSALIRQTEIPVAAALVAAPILKLCPG